MRGQPFFDDQTNQRGKRFPVAEEPGLRHNHRLDKFLKFIIRTVQLLPIIFAPLQSSAGHSEADSPVNAGTPDGSRVEADCLLQQIFEIEWCHYSEPIRSRNN